MPRWDFWGKRGLWDFRVNPQNRRNRKPIFEVNEYLVKLWYQKLKNEEIVDTSLFLIQAKKEELEKLSKNKDVPMYARIISRELLSKRWFDIIMKLLEKAFWTKYYIDMQNQIANNVFFILPDNGRDNNIKWQTNETQKILEK